MFNDAKEYVKRCPQCQNLLLPKADRAWTSIHYRVCGPSCNEDRCSGPTFPSTSSVLVPTGLNRLLHQIDRSCAPLEVTGHQVVKFLWQNLVCRFRLPHTIISDNGTNFTRKRWLPSVPTTRSPTGSLHHTIHRVMVKLR